MITLKQSGVVFNQEQHTYSYEGASLQGITSTLLQKVFPDKYGDVPEDVLQRAADRGTVIHEQIELTDSIGILPDVPEVKAYLQEREKFGLSTVSNEYIVTDFEHFASAIDLVMADDADNITLADIKTTYAFDREYVSWQLSIYAYLFERQNLGLTVSHLFGVWLPKKGGCQFIEVQRHSDAEIESLIEAFLNGEVFSPGETQVALITPDAVKLLIEATTAYEEAKQAMDDVKNALLRAMEDNHIRSWETEQLKATYTQPTEATSFDVKRFQQEHPDLYSQYLKTTTKKASVRVTIR